MRGIYKKTNPHAKKWTKGGKRRDKRKGYDKRTRRDKRRMRGSGNCGSSGCLKPKENPWHQVDRESSRKTLYTNNSQNMAKNKSQEESLDELIKSLEDENFTKEEQEEHVIANQQVDWTAIIKAAEVANQNEKKGQEIAANKQISNYKQRTQTRADQAIQHMFHRKTQRKTP
jgi:hypothetical protein